MKGQCLILDLLGWDDYRAKVMSTYTFLPVPSRSKPPRSVGRSRHSTIPPLKNNLPILQKYFNVLFRAYGPQGWWPGRTRFEIIVGAILTQNTSWANVERAIQSLRRERLLCPDAIAGTSTENLASLIRSSGYFRQKARKLKEFVAFLQANYDGSLSKLFRSPTTALREQLLVFTGSARRLPIRSCSTREVILCLLSTRTPAEYWNGMNWFTEKIHTRDSRAVREKSTV